MRLFVALGLPEPVRDEIRSWLLRTKASFPSERWVRPENAHLTLRFLSEVAEDRV
jgi:2'-5' RNA ligase